MSAQEADALVQSPAAHYFKVDTFRKLVTSLSEHKAVLEAYGTVPENRGIRLEAKVFVTPPGVTRTSYKLNPSPDFVRPFVWSWGGGEYPQVLRVWSGSVLSELQKLAARLAETHPWSVQEAMLFVLTEKAMWVSPLAYSAQQTGLIGVAAHRYERSQITLTVAPWVKESVVLEAYRKIRCSLGYSDRRWEGRNVAVFRFVLQQSKVEVLKKPGLLGDWRAKLVLPAWKELRRRWNENYSAETEWHYGQNDAHAKIFRRDFARGQEVVIGTRYGLPGVRGMPMTPAEEQRMMEGVLGNDAR